MKRKLITFFILIGFVFNLNIIFDKVAAEEATFSIYEMPFADGPRYYNTDVSANDCIGLSEDSSCIYHLRLAIDNDTIEEFEPDKLTVSSSNDRVLKVSLQSKSIEISALSEGVAIISITYNLDGTVYSLGKSWRINPEEPQVVSGVGAYVFLDQSDLLMNIGDIEEVSVYYDLYGTTAVDYPDGYTENNYYEYAWESTDSSIAKIKGSADEEIVEIEGIKSGETTVKCTITSVDGEMTPIVKTVKVTIIDKLADLYGAYQWVNNSDLNLNRKKLYLELNENGTAKLVDIMGDISESTSGTYIFENGSIIYTKVNYNDDDKTEYPFENKVVEFKLLEAGKLELIDGNESFVLTKLSSGTGDNPKTLLDNNSIIIVVLVIVSIASIAVIKKYTKFPKHN